MQKSEGSDDPMISECFVVGSGCGVEGVLMSGAAGITVMKRLG